MASNLVAPVTDPEKAETPEPPVLQQLQEANLVSVETGLRVQVEEIGQHMRVQARSIVIFIHRKFIIVAYDW